MYNFGKECFTIKKFQFKKMLTFKVNVIFNKKYY